MSISKKNKNTQKRKEKRFFSIFRRLPLLLSLTRRSFFFFLFILISQIFLFFMGNMQNFLEKNLNLILTLCCYSAIGAAFFSFAAFAECIYYYLTKKKKFFLIHMIIFFLLFLVTLSISLISKTINSYSQGIL